MPADADEQAIRQNALANDKVALALDGKSPKKVIVIKLRLVNIVV
jgi:leucyl-tRNA synthetase